MGKKQELVDQDLVKDLDQVGDLVVYHYLVSEDQDPVGEVLKIKDPVQEKLLSIPY